MPAYHVEKTVKINGSKSQVLAEISDFRQWPAWSPWLILEPKCSLNYTGEQGQESAGYSWDGDMVGAGEMQLTGIGEQQLEMSLTFLRPFKSEAKVVFDIIEQADSCLVTWHMYGSLPFYLFFMKKMMQGWIGMDYERGLRMLKSVVETTKVNSTPEIIGYAEQPAQYYIGLTHSASIEAIGPIMREDFARLNEYVRDKNIVVTGAPFTLYHKMNMVTTESNFTSALPVSEKIEVPAPFEFHQLKATKTWQVKHTGHYEFLGNAWALAMMASRHQKVKTRKKPMGIERYLNDPATTPAEALETQVALLCK